MTQLLLSLPPIIYFIFICYFSCCCGVLLCAIMNLAGWWLMEPAYNNGYYLPPLPPCPTPTRGACPAGCSRGQGGGGCHAAVYETAFLRPLPLPCLAPPLAAPDTCEARTLPTKEFPQQLFLADSSCYTPACRHPEWGSTVPYPVFPPPPPANPHRPSSPTTPPTLAAGG